MPVTTEVARHYGFELFGFPKSVESITVERLSRVCTTTVSSDGSVVLRTRVQLRPGLKIPVPWLVTYTQKTDSVLRTRIKTRWWVTLSPGIGSSVEIAQPEHPVALKLLQLRPSKSPLFVLHGERF